jgi:hypothetical protein
MEMELEKQVKSAEEKLKNIRNRIECTSSKEESVKEILHDV